VRYPLNCHVTCSQCKAASFFRYKKIPVSPRNDTYAKISERVVHKQLTRHVAVGVLLAFAFVAPSDIHDMHNQLTLLMQELDFPLPQIPGFDLSRFEYEWDRLRSNIPEVWKFNHDGREFQVGEQMAARGFSAEYPVVLIPGVISTVSLGI